MKKEYQKTTEVNIDQKNLISNLKIGDQRTFNVLFTEYKELIYNHAYRMVKDDDACKDIVQETFLSLWNHKEKLDDNRPIQPYLITIVRNKVLDYISKTKVRNSYKNDIKQFIDTGICYTDEFIIGKEMATLFELEKSKLSLRTREVFELNREFGLSYKEIGEKLSISDKTAKKMVHNALKVLKTKIIPFLYLIFLD